MKWRAFSHLGGAYVTVSVPLALITLGGDARKAGLAALLANALSHAMVQLLKRAVARPRPCDVLGNPLALVELPDPFSFPSGHAAAAFAVAVPVSIAWPLLAPVMLGLAAMIAASRAVLRVHYWSDVMVGVALGALALL